MNPTIALLAEVPESLHQELANYLDQTALPTNRSEILVAALSLFLSQNALEQPSLTELPEPA